MITKERQWLNERIGNFTASNIHKLLVSGKSKDKMFGDTAMTYILETVSSMLTGESGSDLKLPALEWGRAYEKEAVDMYIERTGRNGHYFGSSNPVFFKLPDMCCGGSPDFLIENVRVAEFKCPHSSVNHIRYSLLTLDDFKKNHLDYYSQCQLLMVTTNTMVCDFVSYDPRVIDDDLSLFVLEVPFDLPFWVNLRERIREAERIRNDIYGKIVSRKYRKAS